MAVIGDLSQVRGEAKFEWKLKDFLNSFLLSTSGKNGYYFSPEFIFFGETWMIRIYPNGHPQFSAEWIDLFLERMSTDSLFTVDCSFSLKTVDGKTLLNRTSKGNFYKSCTRGFSESILRSVLIERKSQLLPSGVLTIVCTLKKSETCDVVGNEDYEKADVFVQTEEKTGVWKLQQQLKETLQNGNVSDVVLKVDDKEFQSHRCILATRSPVFLAMMTHDTKEKNTGVVDIKDVDPGTFSDFLHYLYTGSEEYITPENFLKLYIAADKYQVDELKKVCVDHMLKNISVDNFCDILTLSLQHAEKEVIDACSQFYNKNTLAIILTSKWIKFLEENPVAGNELHIKQLQVNK